METFCSSFQGFITKELQKLTAVIQDMVQQQKDDRIAITRLEKKTLGVEVLPGTDAAVDATNTIPRIPPPAASTAFLSARLGTRDDLVPPRPTSPVGWRTRHGDHADTRPPRFHKLEFSTYDGEGDPLPWLNRCVQFFAGQRTPASEKTWLASYHLTGLANLWYCHMERKHGQPAWEDFVAHISRRFGPPSRSNPFGELISLRRSGTVADYQKQ